MPRAVKSKRCKNSEIRVKSYRSKSGKRVAASCRRSKRSGKKSSRRSKKSKSKKSSRRSKKSKSKKAKKSVDKMWASLVYKSAKNADQLKKNVKANNDALVDGFVNKSSSSTPFAFGYKEDKLKLADIMAEQLNPQGMAHMNQGMGHQDVGQMGDMEEMEEMEDEGEDGEDGEDGDDGYEEEEQMDI